MTECPNCLTPWKCNGPHMTDDLPPPEPHLKLMWRDGQYRVSRANVDWMDCYTADQMRAYGDARAAAERERCALICESRITPGTGSVAILNGAADTIRAGS